MKTSLANSINKVYAFTLFPLCMASSALLVTSACFTLIAASRYGLKGDVRTMSAISALFFNYGYC